MDIKKMHNAMIGRRIKLSRKKAELFQWGIHYIDTSVLSKIERGRTTNKNPYFINKEQLKFLSNALNVSATDIIWGNDEEKERFIKIIILALLLNSSENAFQNYSIHEWVAHEWNYDPAKIKEHLNDIENTKNTYGFFANEENYLLYELMQCEFDSRIERVSNLLLKQLLHDYDFSEHFYNHIIAYSTNIDLSSAEQFVREFLANQGSYSLFILDKNGIDYPLFVRAFNKYWDKVSKNYREFFEKEIFTDESELLEHSIKRITNDYIIEKLTSNEFLRLNEELFTFSEYNEPEAIISSINMRYKFINAILRGSLSVKSNLDKDFVSYFSGIKNHFDIYTDIFHNEKSSTV